MGTEFILEAVSFTQQKNIERSAPSIQETLIPKGGTPEIIGTGKAINYKITDKYAGKEIVFRAFIKKDSYKMYPQQCLTCFIEEKVSTAGILIKEVDKSGSVKVEGIVECKVTRYNKPSDKITEAQKRSIKWDVKVGDREKKVFTTDKNEPYRGETIKFKVPKSWSGKNVILMPYLNQSTEKVSISLSVETSIKDTQKCDCICEERVRAFMRMLRVGEGTVGEEGYEKLFGGKSFIKDYKKGWSTHPQILISKSGLKSTAAGAYQIMGYTYKELNGWSKNSSSNLYDKYTESKDYLKKHKITDFSPLSQDLICLVILRYKRNGILKLITGGNVKEALEKYGSYEWASLPPGRYGQPAKTMDEALALYDKYYKEELSVKSDLHLKQGFLKDFYSECCCQYNQVCSIDSKYNIDKAVAKLIFNKKTNSQVYALSMFGLQ
ncbi:glycoside hydrolase family 24 protein [Coprobacter tertius]|uniref:Glycoside hydrolase family 104 protein n=1 Tax=Coprobacter tertius TaxID=2944915 RepID=A0ABT1MES9_9BACT|nr:glycoside hydrolase family 104 protein [Coprobacter tertius]MCP9610874.1 glycoside hydrolase family 104 protein [Coprobacter tertius]